MFKQVFLKEWCYQRWKVIFGAAMLIFFTGSLWAARVTTVHEAYIMMWMLGALPLSLFSAVGTFAPEIADGTRMFLVAKPIRPWKVFWAKWLMGWLNFTIPLLVCGLVIMLTILFRSENRRDELDLVVRGTTGSIGFGTMFYTMTCCFAPRKSGEAAVGVVGLLVLLGVVSHLFFIFLFLDYNRLFEVFFYVNPLAWIALIERTPSDSSLLQLFVPQSLLFGITAMIGYRKWKRG